MFTILGSISHEQVIDAFSYTDAQAARNVWVAGTETMPVRVVQDIRRPVLEFLAAFDTDRQLQRTIHDRRVALDLAAAGEFTLELTASDPEGISQVTLYFRSGTGWFGSSQNVTQPGWQTLRFPKSSFRVENQPVGWNKIGDMTDRSRNDIKEQVRAAYERVGSTRHGRPGQAVDGTGIQSEDGTGERLRHG